MATNSLKENRHLFGGALFSAGIVAAAATMTAMTTTATADFIAAAPPDGFGSSYSQVYGNGSAANVNLSDSTVAAAFPTPQSYSGNGLDMSAYAGVNLMGASLNLTDAATWNDSALAITFQWFTVESDKEVTLEWDFTNADNGTTYVFQLGVGNIYLATDPTAGSVALNLTPGLTYAFVGFVQQNGTNGGGFARLTNIPAPGSLALLGIGMFSARSRRRRE